MPTGPKEQPVGFVYLIGSKANTLVKIGKAVDVPKRLKGIQAMSPMRLEVLWQTEGAHSLEQALHERFAKFRQHGEWFDFGRKDAVALVSTAAAELQLIADQAVPEVTTEDSGIKRGYMATDQFTQISNALFRDSRLSAKAMGVFGHISTHEDGYGITAESISRHVRDGVSAIKGALRELEEYGYLVRSQERRSDGTLGVVVYEITGACAREGHHAITI